MTVLLDQFDGKPLIAPNCVTVHSDGAIWFTDPGSGIEGKYEGDKAPLELPRRVYRIDADTGEATVVITEMDRPNVIAFSPDEKRLYVIDVGQIRVFDVENGTTAVNGRSFVQMSPGGPDALALDRDGNVWVSAGMGGAGFDGVHC